MGLVAVGLAWAALLGIARGSQVPLSAAAETIDAIAHAD